jgi:hypothetical protein
MNEAFAGPRQTHLCGQDFSRFLLLASIIHIDGTALKQDCSLSGLATGTLLETAQSRQMLSHVPRLSIFRAFALLPNQA